MENKNKQSNIENPSTLPSEQPTDDRLSEAMSQNEDIILPDPSCFADLGDAPEDPAPYPIDTAESYDDGDSVSREEAEKNEATAALYHNLVKRRKKSRRLIVTLACIVGFILICSAMIFAYLKFYKPTVDSDPPPFLNNNAVTADGDETGNGNGDETNTPDTDNSGNQGGADDYQRKQDVYNFLVLGIDRLAHLSDVIMVVSYDVQNNEMSVLSLPRDTYVNIGANYHKLNAYFAAAYNRSGKGSEDARLQDAASEMASFLEQGLCLNIDRYVCIDTAGFRDVVDAIGGVDMEVPFDMEYYDEYQDLYIDLKAGYQHLDGNMAEQFVRFRSGYLNGDIGRISAQRLFLTSLINQIKKSFNVSTIVALTETMINYVNTDLSLAEIGYFAKSALSINMEKIHFTTLPGGGVTNPNTGAAYYVIYAENARKIVNSYFNVYSRDISRDLFLANATCFTSDEEYIAKVFASEIADDGTVSGDDVASGEVNIPTRG